ncbi:prostatic acid phosphatase-like isoform X2 [Frankliniella occidentalis]|uniref:acid phosphatase n=1 Tax=Frankliniella occidentalis TaxID=133901 RepID=A0A9C6X913_FRAOC|nr:prostatic acid phosphatase-like isoform X2 [Frankliniella occidentalis]
MHKHLPKLLLQSQLALLLALFLAAPPAEAAPPPGYTLEQLHVVFRHGNRTPEAPYPTDPNKNYTWPPMGWDQLSQAGIASTFRLGRLFRQLYGDFLGDLYYQTDVNATSTDIPRTKLSLQAFMAGLFPAKGSEQWDAPGSLGASWQPFVYHYMPKHLDDYLYMNGVECPRYAKEFAQAERSDRVRQILGSDPAMVAELTEKAGIGNSLAQISRFYCTISIETDEGRIVPSWVKPFYPERLEKVSLWHFHVRVLTRVMQRLKAGPLVKHLVATMKETRDGAKKPRLWIYSGHDDTVSALGLAIRTWGAMYPDFNAMLVLELLKKADTGEYAVQVLVRESHAVDAHVVPVEGCDGNPCPLDKFHELVKDVIPQDWRKECQIGEEKKRIQTHKNGILVANGTVMSKNKI